MNARWATFDCYGTLVDWNAGIQAEPERLFGTGEGPRLLQRYHELEPRIQRENPQVRYRDVMAAVVAAVASESGRELTEEDGGLSRKGREGCLECALRMSRDGGR